MAPPVKINYKIFQGSTFKEVLRWESNSKTYKTITAIAKGAPTVITSVAHGLTSGWRFKITDVGGMKEINSATSYQIAKDVTSDSITLELNSTPYTTYTSGGVIEYYTPVDLTGYSARLQIREKLTSDTFLLELTTENGGITLDSTQKTITLNITAAQTAALNFTSAVYSLEMVKAGEVTQLVTGNISLEKEITR